MSLVSFRMSKNIQIPEQNSGKYDHLLNFKCVMINLQYGTIYQENAYANYYWIRIDDK